MKLLFVDHSFHEKTRSSAFFVEILAARNEVDIVYIDPLDSTSALKLVVSKYDAAVVWQMDFLAPIFLAQGLKTFVVPMYDGSANMPDLHWRWSERAHFINFSRRLHHRVSALGCSSFYLRYFRAPAPEKDIVDFDETRAFFWQRTPEHGLNLALVKHLIGDQLTSLHLHDAPDNPELVTNSFLAVDLPGVSLSRSKWLKDGRAYRDLLKTSNIFVAPRYAEGIGMAVLEAMSLGMVVIAADRPTHDEYISNWITGILYNPYAPSRIDLHGTATQKRLGRAAWRSVSVGYDAFNARLPQLHEYMEAAPSPTSHANAGRLLAHGEQLIRAYLAGETAYSAFLTNNRSISGIKDDKTARKPPEEKPSDTPWLDQHRLDMRALAAGKHLLDGRVHEKDGIAWMLTDHLDLAFKLDRRLGATNRLKICLRNSGAPKPYCITLNGATLAIGEATAPLTHLEFELDLQDRRVENRLELRVQGREFSPAPDRLAGLGLEELAFV